MQNIEFMEAIARCAFKISSAIYLEKNVKVIITRMI